MTVVVLLWFSRRGCHSAIFSHVSKVVTFVTFHFNAQRFKPVVIFLCVSLGLLR
jgi:hypothetical protein